MATPETPRGRRRFAVVPAVATAIGVLILIGLGVWQIQRLHWKQGVLAHVAALRAAPAQPLAPVLERARSGQDVDYTRVAAVCPQLEHGADLKLYTVTDAGPGYRVISACTISIGPYRSILVDRGIVPSTFDWGLMPARIAPLGAPIVGILRKGDPPTFVTPANDPAHNLWYWRDIPAMAKALGVAAPAPSFLMLESPSPPPGGPQIAPLPSDIPNNHLQYAITWFGLAAALAGVYLASLWAKRPR